MSLSSVIRYVEALDTSSTTGAGKTALAFSDFTAKYLTEGGTLTSLTTETITTLGTYQAPTSAAHIRIKELSNADPSKGIYEVHLHDSQVAVAGKNLWLMLSAPGAKIQPLWVPLADLSGRVPAALTANGNMKSSLLEIISTALSEGATGRIAAAFQTAWNVASSVWTAASVNQTGDSYARLGAPAGASIAADIAAAKTDTGNLVTRVGTPYDLGSGATVAGNLVDIESQTGEIGAAGAGLSAIPKTGFKLASDGLDSVLIESSISAGADLTNDTGTQLTSINARQAMALFAAALEGVLAGAATTTITIKPAGKPSGNTRVTATVDSSGNRSALTLKVPD